MDRCVQFIQVKGSRGVAADGRPEPMYNLGYPPSMQIPARTTAPAGGLFDRSLRQQFSAPPSATEGAAWRRAQGAARRECPAKACLRARQASLREAHLCRGMRGMACFLKRLLSPRCKA